MHLLVYLPLAIPLLAAACARRVAELLPPRTATWLLVGSALALAVASCAVLGLLALSAAVRIPLVDAAAGISLRAVNRSDAASVPLGVLAGALLGAAALAAVRAAWLRAVALIGAHRQTRTLSVPGGHEPVVVADNGVDAYTVPGWPSKIVITSGMLDALTPAERQVLIAHERAHAAGHHYLFAAAARLAAAANPLLSPVAAAVGYSVERWADEAAAAEAGSRPLAARTVAKAALAASASPARRAPAFAVLGVLPRRSARRRAHSRHACPSGSGPFAATGPARLRRLLSRGPGLVPRRVAALLEPPPRRRLLLVAVAVAVVALSCLSALEVAGALHHMIEAAQLAGG